MGEAREGVRGRHPVRPDVVLAVVVAIAIAIVGLSGAQRSRLLTIERRAADDEAALGRVAAGVAVDLERGLGVLAGTARTTPAAVVAAGGVQLAEIPGATAVGFVPAEAETGSTGGELVLPDDVRDDRSVAALLDRARDSGDAHLGGPVELSEGPRSLAVAALYEAGSPPRTTVERRSRLVGWVVATIDLGMVAQLHLPAGTAAWVRDGGTTFSATGVEVPPRLPLQRVEVRGHPLVVRAGDPDGIGLVAPSVALGVSGVLLGALVGAAVLAMARRLRATQAEATRAGERVELIGEVAPLVQQSLELADVLPSVAIQLADHFGLDGVRLSAGSSSAGQLELFNLGARPASDSPPVLHPPAALAAGETLTLALQRGGRSVALLQVLAGRDLDEADLHSLRALTELVTAAVVNASLFAQQQDAMRRLRELDGLKTVFLGTASHELRTPATAIGGFAALLSGSWERFDDTQRREFATRIAANARSLGAVVQDLLDFSQFDRGAVALALEPVDLGELVPAVVDRLDPVLVDRRVRCSIEGPPLVAGDVNGLERIVSNLLTNAAKFSPPGSVISVVVAPDGDGAALVVSDQGPGVPEEERERVFARFYRGTGDAVLQTRGVGIGLSVVAEFVARMGGEVAVDDAPGGGARFTVRLRGADALVDNKESEDASTA